MAKLRREPVNFKDTAEEDYRLYRLLQAPAFMIPTYQERIKAIGKYRGAVIFPEQFVACYDNGVFLVSINTDQDTLSMSVMRMRNFSIWGGQMGGPIMSMADVIRVEQAFADDRNKELFVIRRQKPPKRDETLRLSEYIDTKIGASNSYWFSNKSDALSFARSCVVLPS